MYYVGIDIGGMSIKFGLVDEAGAIIYKTVLIVDYNEVSIEKTISLMKDKIEELCTGAKIHLKDIKGIGIGCPGVCNTDEGILVNAPNLKWHLSHSPICCNDHSTDSNLNLISVPISALDYTHPTWHKPQIHVVFKQ